MVEYIVKSGLCLLVLFSFYKLFMEGETFHRIKRIYLLLALAISIILPVITIRYSVEIPTEDVGETIVFSSTNSASEVSEIPFWKEYLPYLLFIIYFIGFSIFGYRFYKNLKALISEAKKNDKLQDLPYIYVLLGRKLDPHSFFQYIFLNKEEFKKDQISSAVMEHEKAHVDQKHSLDLLLLELLHVVFWFNPVFIFIKKSVKLNHEFLADHSVLQKAYSPLEYSNILFQYSSGHHHNALSSPINHSLIKKRIIMITKSFSLRRLLLKTFIFLPVLGGCVYLFNEEIVAKPILSNSEKINSLPADFQQDRRTIKIKVNGEKILLNKKEVSLIDFSEALNKFTSNWSQEDLKHPWFVVDFENSTTEFIEKLNTEYRKSKLSKISNTEFLAPSSEAYPGTPPPPPPPPVIKRDGNVPAPAQLNSDKYSDRENLFSVHIIGNTLKVNGKDVKPKDFSSALDKLAEGKTDEELNNYNFRMHISDPAPGFMEELNKEFKKSRISKVTGHEILPPPPPAPPRFGGDHNSSKSRKNLEERRQRLDKSREKLIEKEAEFQAEQEKFQRNNKMSSAQREKKRKEIERSHKELEKAHKEMELVHKEMESAMLEMEQAHANIPPPPPPPISPEEAIDEIIKEGGNFYYEGKSISSEKAKQIISNNKSIQIRVNGELGKAAKMEISNN